MKQRRIIGIKTDRRKIMKTQIHNHMVNFRSLILNSALSCHVLSFIVLTPMQNKSLATFEVCFTEKYISYENF